ncbi:hypothetical protein DQ240_19885 [Blastococcus sp. TF02A-26]|nr:hypothetical protein DQ240_19885 [Blastococcus sp. TF02A-26]
MLYELIDGLSFGRSDGAVLRFVRHAMNEKNKYERVGLAAPWPDKSGLYIVHRGDVWVDFPTQTKDHPAVLAHPDVKTLREDEAQEFRRIPLFGCHETVETVLNDWGYDWFVKGP